MAAILSPLQNVNTVTGIPDSPVTMPGSHNMNIIIFGAGLLGVVALAIHLGHSLPKYAQYVQDSNDHYAAGEPEKNIGMSQQMIRKRMSCIYHLYNPLPQCMQWRVVLSA